MRNEYIFDWNIVLALCPDYKQYLHNNKPDNNDIDIITHIDTTAPREINTPNTIHQNTDTSDKELDIINLMSNTNVKPDTHTSIKYAISVSNECAGEPKNIRWYLNEEFEYPGISKQKPCPVQFQLAPPKNVLDVGSVIYEENKEWRINSNKKDRNPHVVNLNKYSIHTSGDKIRLVSIVYRFDRVKNVTSEMKTYSKFLVYNKKTRRLYRIFTAPKKKNRRIIKYNYVIQSITMNGSLCSIHPSTYLQSKFLSLIEKAVRCDVPDVYTPTFNSFTYILETLILQHKVGKRIDWMDPKTYQIATQILHLKHTGINDDVVDEKKQHKTIMRKFIPQLKKHTNYTSLIQAAFGKKYNKTILKLISITSDIYTLLTIADQIYKKTMLKTTRHLLTNIINSELSKVNKQGALREIADLPNENGPTIKAWLITVLRFVKSNQRIISWYRWRDTYTMANRYHIRIRPRKFNNAEDINKLHTQLIEIQNRDRKVLREMKDVKFIPFEHPEKKYNGFQFMFLGTPDALVEEGISMHHCVGGYAGRCLIGHSLIFSMRKNDVGYVTVELNGETYKVRQKYTIGDNTVNNMDICNIIDEWQKDVFGLHIKDEKNYQYLCNQVLSKNNPELLENLRNANIMGL